jgi:hypothetical protein
MADRALQQVRMWLESQPFSFRLLTLMVFMIEAIESEYGKEISTNFENELRTAFTKARVIFKKPESAEGHSQRVVTGEEAMSDKAKDVFEMSDKAKDFFASTLAQHLRNLQAVARTTDEQREVGRKRMHELIKPHADEIFKGMTGPDVLLMHLEQFIELANFIAEPESVTKWLWFEQQRRGNAVQ